MDVHIFNEMLRLVAFSTYYAVEYSRCSSPWLISPLRSLADHELAGGHLIARHIGQSLRDLEMRLQNEVTLRAASSFWDQEAAKASVCYAVMSSLSQVLSWLQAGPNNRLPITTNVPVRHSIGYALVRNQVRVRFCRNVRVVLERLQPNDFFIVTGYPIP